MTISENIVLTARNQAKGAFGELDRDVRQAIGSMGKFNTSGNQAFISGLQKSNASLGNFGTMLVDAADKAGLGTSEIAKMAGATGIFSEQQILAARASGAMATKASELAVAVSKGEMTTRTAGRAFREFADETMSAANASGVSAQSLAGLASKAALAATVVATAGIALKKGFDFGREGAQLDLTRDRFDRLAQSIGTTSDVLLTRLRGAAKGMMSDAELIGSATDLITLGLAKTEDEAVRLTKVSSLLGMNMNQLVLTLTNQTTMRFDALGLSVDGFEEKVKSLEEAGLATNEAFKLAFLETAEQKLGMLGDVSETSAGKIAQMDAAWANYADTLRLQVAPLSAKIAQELANLLPIQAETIDWTQAQFKTVKGSERVYVEFAGQIRDVTAAYREYLEETGKTPDEVQGFSDARLESINEFRERLEYAGRAASKAADQTYEYVYRASDVDREARRAAQAVKNFGQQVEEAGDAAMSRSEQIGNLLGVLDRDVGSPIADFISDMKWLMAGGGEINAAFEALKSGVASGAISPQDAEKWAGELFVATTDLQAELDMISAEDAAKNLQETMGVSLTEAKDMINGTDSIAAALHQIAGTEWNINLRFNYEGQYPPGWGSGGTFPGIGAGGSGGGGGGGSSSGGGSSGGGGGTYNPGGGAVGVQSIIPPAGGEVMVPIGSVGGGGGAGVGAVGGAKVGGGDLYVEQTIIAAPGMSPEDVAAMTVQQLDAARRAWAAGAGYVG